MMITRSKHGPTMYPLLKRGSAVKNHLLSCLTEGYFVQNTEFGSFRVLKMGCKLCRRQGSVNYVFNGVQNLTFGTSCKVREHISAFLLYNDASYITRQEVRLKHHFSEQETNMLHFMAALNLFNMDSMSILWR